MTAEVKLPFCQLVKCLQPVTGKGLAGGDQVAEVVAMLTAVPEDRWGTDGDPSHLAAGETARKMYSSDKYFTKKLANAILECLDLSNFIYRIDGAAPPTKQVVVNNLAARGVHASITDLGSTCAHHAQKVINAKAGKKDNDAVRRMQLALAQAIATNRDSLLLQADGCTRCHRPLIATEGTRRAPSFRISPIDPSQASPGFDDLVVLCPQCGDLLGHHEIDDEEIDRLRHSKRQLISHDELLESMVPLRLEKEIAELVAELGSISVDDATDEARANRNYDPAPIREKIPDDEELFLEVADAMSLYFPVMSRRMKDLEITHQLDFEMLSLQVRSKYLELAQKTNEQTEIFDSLTTWVKTRTSKRGRSCAVLVAYFVQMCEVFHAPAQ